MESRGVIRFSIAQPFRWAGRPTVQASGLCYPVTGWNPAGLSRTRLPDTSDSFDFVPLRGHSSCEIEAPPAGSCPGDGPGCRGRLGARRSHDECRRLGPRGWTAMGDPARLRSRGRPQASRRTRGGKQIDGGVARVLKGTAMFHRVRQIGVVGRSNGRERLRCQDQPPRRRLGARPSGR